MMMVNQEETIKSLQNEVLRLKLTCHNYERQLSAAGRPPGRDLDETKRDLIADLMEANDELKNQLSEKNQDESRIKPQTAEASCQTKLDWYAMDQLIEDSLTLKKQKKLHTELTEQFHQVKQSLLYHQTIIHQTQQQQHQQLQQQQQQQQMQQHQHQQQQQTRQQQHASNYNHHRQSEPAKPLQRHPTSSSRDYQTIPGNRNMTLDEKETLDKLFKLDGLLTTARDKLRAAVYN